MLCCDPKVVGSNPGGVELRENSQILIVCFHTYGNALEFLFS